MFKLISILGSVTVMSGCVINQPAKPNDPYYAPVMQANPYPEQPSSGSLFSANTSMVLFTDQKATRVGDIITVMLKERTTSKKTSNVEMIKDSDMAIAPTLDTGLLFGSNIGVGEYNLNTNLRAEREFTGEADADQSNMLSGDISVTVVAIHPNGNLVVRGEKWITLNRGDEFIRISGIVRTEDISPDNTIASNKIADARITYSGTGDFADTQQMGWLSRFFNSPIWPF